MGHEFAAEVARAGRQRRQLRGRRRRRVDADRLRRRRRPPGRLLQRLPRRLRRADGAQRPARPQGAQRPVARRAALTEPMAVGLHAVNRSQVTPAHTAVVLGAGPVGLAVIAALHAAGRRADRRRRLLPDPAARWPLTMGAHEVVDPAVEPAIDAWRRLGGQGPARHLRGGRRARACSTPPCATRPAAPRSWWSACACSPTPCGRCSAIGKELNLQFVLGYDPLEFAETPAPHRRGRARRRPADHRLGRHRRHPRGVRGPRPIPTPTPRSWSSPRLTLKVGPTPADASPRPSICVVRRGLLRSIDHVLTGGS